ncbi:MAG TPA: HRDC domain-containing protein [Anaerolineales bacterium]|nr:HRDC domain-containing protein [Anaerolineales bacterium]
MTNQALPPPVWVDQPNALNQMVADLAGQTCLAVDTESNSLHAYREQVCLIQFSTPKTDYVIDPLAFDDLSSLGPIFKNPGIEKIFHAAEYDLICLRRDFGFEFANLFDTMHAARVLGYPFVGLDNLLAEKFQFELDKRHQKADWAMRPLTPAQLDYARLDTHFLFALREVLETELKEKDRLQIAHEDFVRACHVDLPEEKANGTSWKRFSLRKDISTRELTVLRELCTVRSQIAERMNRPVFKVVADALLVDIARNLPEKDVDLAGLGLSPKQIRLWGDEILEAVKRGAVAPLVERGQQARRPNDATLKRLQRLKNWRKKVAEELKVESDIILPKPYLNKLAEHPPKSLQDLETIMQESQTRFNRYGEQIYRLVGG